MVRKNNPSHLLMFMKKLQGKIITLPDKLG